MHLKEVQDLDSCSSLWGFHVSLEQGSLLLVFVRPGFTFLSGWKNNIKKRNSLWCEKNERKFKFQSISKLLLEHSHTHLFMDCCKCLCISASEMSNCKSVWPTKYKIFSIWPFTENMCWPLVLSLCSFGQC